MSKTVTITLNDKDYDDLCYIAQHFKTTPSKILKAMYLDDKENRLNRISAQIQNENYPC